MPISFSDVHFSLGKSLPACLQVSFVPRQLVYQFSTLQKCADEMTQGSMHQLCDSACWLLTYRRWFPQPHKYHLVAPCWLTYHEHMLRSHHRVVPATLPNDVRQKIICRFPRSAHFHYGTSLPIGMASAVYHEACVSQLRHTFPTAAPTKVFF